MDEVDSWDEFHAAQLTTDHAKEQLTVASLML